MLRQTISLVLLFFVNISEQQTRFRVIYEWNYINFTWPSPEEYATAIRTATYIVENNHISGVKYFDDYLYVTVPRMKEGVPATLNRIPYNAQQEDTSPLLEPYPSWEMNAEGDCNALQNVQNIEIDTKGLMWILDGGSTETLAKTPANKCRPRLIICDIQADRVVTIYTFPEEMTKEGSFLYDLVVDDIDGGYAYITDNSAQDPAIIVYSMKENRAWIIRDEKSMTASEEAFHFTVNGTGITTKINIAGIALGPRLSSYGEHDIVTQDRFVYYSPLSSYRLYSVNSAVLRDKMSAINGIATQVKDLGSKASQTDGMVMDENGILYYGLLADNSIAKWDSKTPFTSEQKIIARDKTYIQWPDSLCFDMSGNLLVVTNKLQKYIYGRLNLTEPNFRILEGHVGAKSYLYNVVPFEIRNMEINTTSTTKNIPSSVDTSNTTRSKDNLYYEIRTTQKAEIEHYKDLHITNTSTESSAATLKYLNNFGIIFIVLLLIKSNNAYYL